MILANEPNPAIYGSSLTCCDPTESVQSLAPHQLYELELTSGSALFVAGDAYSLKPFLFKSRPLDSQLIRHKQLSHVLGENRTGQ